MYIWSVNMEGFESYTRIGPSANLSLCVLSVYQSIFKMDRGNPLQMALLSGMLTIVYSNAYVWKWFDIISGINLSQTHQAENETHCYVTPCQQDDINIVVYMFPMDLEMADAYKNCTDQKALMPYFWQAYGDIIWS